MAHAPEHALAGQSNLLETGWMNSRIAARLIAVAGTVLLSTATTAQSINAGDRFELQLKRHSENRSESHGEKGSSDDTDTLTERVISTSSSEMEVEYDLPAGATEKDRLIAWQYPARIRLSVGGTKTLLNAKELELRRDDFLKAGGIDQKACGHWIFTWNAFKIECDPQSVLEIIEAFEIQPKLLADGAPFAMKGALGPTAMKCVAVSKGAQKCSVLMELDADEVRRELANTDVVIGEITGKPISAEHATKQRAATQVSGSIEVTLEADAFGLVWKRTTEVHSKQVDADGKVSTAISTAVLTRKKFRRD